MCIRDSYNTFRLKPVSTTDVYKLLRKLQKRRGGMDDLPPRFLKYITQCLAEPLAYLINITFTTGVIPDDWKTGKITPGHHQEELKVFSWRFQFNSWKSNNFFFVSRLVFHKFKVINKFRANFSLIQSNTRLHIRIFAKLTIFGAFSGLKLN